MLGRTVLCIVFEQIIMPSLIKIFDVKHALYHCGLELRHLCKKCERQKFNAK